MIEVEFSDLLGKTLVSIDGSKGDDAITFQADNGTEYQMYHNQSCCEHVYVEDICGDINDLIGSPIILAEAVSSQDDPEGYEPESEHRESFTWTFYRLRTKKGFVTIRWYGSSNGYYSESVSFCEVKKGGE